MSVMIIGVATDSGVPIMSRKRGNCDKIQFSTIASLHGVNMFSKCHNISMLETYLDNGVIIWKEHCKSITLIGIATGGLECDLKLLLSCMHDVMIFFFGRKEMDSLRNVDQFKRDLRQCYPIFDYLMESLDPTAVNSRPTLTLDLVECILCPQAQQIQEALDSYAECVSGRWACLSVYGRLVATSSDFCDLDPREARLLTMLLATQDGAPLRETPVFLPQMSPNVAFRAVTCKLLADVFILVICGATPPLSQIDEIVLQCWETHAQTIKEAKLVYPRNLPASVHFDPSVLGVLLVNSSSRKCVFSSHLQQANQKGRGMSATHRLDILRTFYVQSARQISPELSTDTDSKEDSADLELNVSESYWSTDYYKCHAQKLGDLLVCVLYSSPIPTHTMRFLSTQMLSNLKTNKDIHW